MSFVAGLSSLCAVAIGLPILAALLAHPSRRGALFAWIVVAVVAVASVLALAYAYAAAFILVAVVKMPLWLVYIGLILQFCGLSAAEYISMAYARDLSPSTVPVRFIAVFLTIVTACAPILFVFAVHEPGLSASVTFYSKPVNAISLIVVGALLSVGFWGGAHLLRPLPSRISKPFKVIMDVAIGAACVLPLVYIALTKTLFLHGAAPLELARFASYQASLEPVAGVNDVFKLTEKYERVVGKSTIATVRVNPQLRAAPDGLLMRVVHFSPLGGNYAGVTADITVYDMPEGTFRDVDFTRSPRNAGSLRVTPPFAGVESAHWIQTSFSDGISFTYIRPLPAPILKVLSPFIGLASFGAWAVAIGSLLFAAVAGKAWDAVADFVIARLKGLFQKPKHAASDQSSNS
ncbi:MAG TPA: hypothetical protein VEV38_09720 [Candidatus Eremiobacteraceae bacterium]|nr:hypothetical protein [Candidatus Eremiobacteraceae bacterium]